MPIPTNSTDQVSKPSSSGSGKVEDKEAKKLIELTYDSPAPLPNRL